jgi:hypothetical protein
LAELDWALANMGGSRSKKQAKSTGEDWVAEAEAKGPKDKEDVCKGLTLYACNVDQAGFLY